MEATPGLTVGKGIRDEGGNGHETRQGLHCWRAESEFREPRLGPSGRAILYEVGESQ